MLPDITIKVKIFFYYKTYRHRLKNKDFIGLPKHLSLSSESKIIIMHIYIFSIGT